MKRILLVFVSLSVALTMLAQNKGTSSTGGLEVVKDAKHPVLQLGDKARCTLTDDGTLVVEGFGILKGARNEKGAPLVKKKINQKIKNIDLTHFSGTLGDYVFYGIDELDAVILNDSALYRFSPRAFWPDIRIGTLEFVNVRNGEKDYRIITNYLPSQESKRCDISSFKDNIQRCIVVRRDHYLADIATIGKKHTGRGLRRWTDRNNGMRLYYGDWVNGEMDGAGIAIMFDGTVRMGQWNENICTGHPEAVGVDLFLDCPEILPLQLIAQHHVEQAVNKWQRKEDYETAKEWGARVNNSSRQQRAIMEYNLLVDRYMKAEASKTDIAFRLGSYDVNHNTYMLSDATYGNIPIALTNAISAAQFKRPPPIISMERKWRCGISPSGRMAPVWPSIATVHSRGTTTHRQTIISTPSSCPSCTPIQWCLQMSTSIFRKHKEKTRRHLFSLSPTRTTSHNECPMLSTTGTYSNAIARRPSASPLIT